MARLRRGRIYNPNVRVYARMAMGLFSPLGVDRASFYFVGRDVELRFHLLRMCVALPYRREFLS